MRISQSIQTAGLIALALIGTAMAAPVPMSLVGTNKLVNVQNRSQEILNGGSFTALVGNVGEPADDSTLFWCVDIENFISPGQPSAQYSANIILISDPRTTTKLVRKGTNNNWEDGADFTAQQRYNGAAFLIEKIIAGGSGFAKDDLQRAIWHLTDLAAGSETDNSPLWANSAYAAATTFISGQTNFTHQWATVSGTLNAEGIAGPDSRQTFLVQVVPEPATYALMGGGLVLLAAIRPRRAS